MIKNKVAKFVGAGVLGLGILFSGGCSSEGIGGDEARINDEIITTGELQELAKENEIGYDMSQLLVRKYFLSEYDKKNGEQPIKEGVIRNFYKIKKDEYDELSVADKKVLSEDYKIAHMMDKFLEENVKVSDEEINAELRKRPQVYYGIYLVEDIMDGNEQGLTKDEISKNMDEKIESFKDKGLVSIAKEYREGKHDPKEEGYFWSIEIFNPYSDSEYWEMMELDKEVTEENTGDKLEGRVFEGKDPEKIIDKLYIHTSEDMKPEEVKVTYTEKIKNEKYGKSLDILRKLREGDIEIGRKLMDELERETEREDKYSEEIMEVLRMGADNEKKVDEVIK